MRDKWLNSNKLICLEAKQKHFINQQPSSCTIICKSTGCIQIANALGQVIYALCIYVSSLQNGDNSNTYFPGLLWGLNEMVSVELLERCLAHSKGYGVAIPEVRKQRCQSSFTSHRGCSKCHRDAGLMWGFRYHTLASNPSSWKAVERRTTYTGELLKRAGSWIPSQTVIL